MELKWLEDFVCLTNTGSFWKASERRHVSQPAFSRRIRALEDWVGVTLIDRSSYPVSLTSHGRQFLPYAQDILETSRSVRDEFRMLSAAAENEVRIAALHTLSIHLLPPVLARLAELRPGTKAVVIPSMQGVEHHFDALANGIVDLLMSYGDEAITANVAQLGELEEKIAGEDEFVPVASAAFAKREALEDLRAGTSPLPFLAYSSFSFSEKLVTPLASTLKNRLRVVYENSLSESLKAMALEGCGIAWLPRSTVQSELEDGRLVCVGRGDLVPRVAIKAYRMRNNASPVLHALWQLL
jgi:LysR family transcriptional regulator, hypochlorite-specific transcription factor HypT